MNRHPVWTALAAGLVLVVSIAWIINSNQPPSHGRSMPENDYFTVDDGETTFVADYKNVPPFDHNGGTAVRAAVFVYGDGGEPFVGYLEKLTPEGKAQMEQTLKNFKPNPFSPPPGVLMGLGAQVKKPRDPGEWVPQKDQRGAAIIDVKCPDGSPARRVRPNQK